MVTGPTSKKIMEAHQLDAICQSMAQLIDTDAWSTIDDEGVLWLKARIAGAQKYISSKTY